MNMSSRSAATRKQSDLTEGVTVARRHRRSAFTLVEVLVVIAVLAVLLAVLMPAFAGARAQAKGLVCRSNLRQLVLAGIGYATENSDFYVPAARDLWDNAGRCRWHGVRSSLTEPFDPAKGPLVGYLTDGRLKECPAEPGFTKSNSWSTSFEKGCGGYGYNMMYLGSRLWDAALSDPQAFQQAYTRTASIHEVTNPGQTLMFADAALANNATNLIEYSFAEPPFAVVAGQVMTDFRMSPSIHFRHGDRANVGWADGHVGSHPMAKVDTTNVYGVDSSTMNLGWFDPVDNTPFDLR